MQAISSLDKLILLKEDIYDLREIALEKVDSLTELIDFAKVAEARAAAKEQGYCFLVNEETLTKLLPAVDCLNNKIMALEEEVHELRVQKTVILPTKELYRNKAEYDALRKDLSYAIAVQYKLNQQLCKAEKEIDAQKEKEAALLARIQELENKLACS